VKRTLFSRSLRILPLPDQVGIVEGLAFLITCFPDVLPLTDQHLLAFLSELLKMLSIADDIVGDTSNVSIGVAVDRNGCVCKTSLANTELGKVALEQPSPPTPVHASKVFLRKEMALRCCLEPSSPDIIVPPELPMGVQLRATALALFRAVVKNHPAIFFNAESNSPAG
jgi:transformation/transcription domain-associated protein